MSLAATPMEERHLRRSLSGRFTGTRPAEDDAVLVNVSATRYSVVSLAAEELGMRVTLDNSAECDLYWIDGGICTEKFLELKHFQHVNHFPGMGEICRKDSLGRNMEKLRKLHKEEYNFVPRTWVLPGEYNSLAYHMRDLKRKRKNKTFIIKPHNAAMGNGIFLTQSITNIRKDQNVVVQEYLDRPFLVDGFKFDLRVYVLITSCNPLRIFVYKDGLVRFSTQQYILPTDTNLDRQYMHLTNYSINKHSTTFDSSEAVDQGSKRTIQFLNRWLAENGYCVGEMWAKIHDIVIKTIIVTSPHLVHSYQACRPGRPQSEKSQFFEILGFDILLDSSLNPWLLEVNRAPSFATDSKLDLIVKTGVIKDALKIMDIRPFDRRKEMVAHRLASRRRLVTPARTSRYDFLAEQEEAAFELERKKKEVKYRLDEIRREKHQFNHEQMYMGDYVRVYPSSDWAREKLYKILIQSASSICMIGRTSRCVSREASPIQKMKEHELVDLLSQYEDEERGVMGSVNSTSACSVYSSSSVPFQPLSLENSHPMDTLYRVMAARVAEEEQTQRTMISLNEMKPSYPGKSSEDLTDILEQIDSNLTHHLPQLSKFWLLSLNNNQRKQLFSPLMESVNRVLQSYWKTQNLDNIRLHQIFKRLFIFILSRGGRGIWSSIVSQEKSWEELFKKRTCVMSVIEMVCCRRIMELAKAVIKVAYYVHHLHHLSKTNPSRTATKLGSSPLKKVSVQKSSSLPKITKLQSTYLSKPYSNSSSLRFHTPIPPTKRPFCHIKSASKDGLTFPYNL